jgi:diguanylate cyclase (GGDEF)-like protein
MQSQGLSTIAVNAAAVLGFALLVRDDALPWLPVWLATALGIVAFRVAMHGVIARASRRDPSLGLSRWRVVYAVGLLGSAGCWAFACVAGYDALPTREQMALLLIVSALAGGATGVLAPLRRVGATYITVLLFGGVLALAFGRVPQPVMATLGFAFLAVMLISHARNHGILAENLLLASQNARLAGELAEHNHELEGRIAERTRALHELAHLDALTGLANRRSLAAAEQDGSTVHAVLFIDLDHFKEINDNKGHPTGDAVLREVARRLRAACGGGTVLARWGGDEFVCLLGDDALQGAEALGAEILKELAGPIALDGGGDVLTLGASIGAARAPEHGTTVSTLIGAADLAAMQAKRDGRGRLVWHSPALSTAWRRRREIEQALTSATTGIDDDGSLSLHYQPIVDREGQPLQLEALLRWHPAELGVVGPAEFIPAAEESGAIHALGDWVLETACRDACRWQQTHPGLAVAINVSMPQLRREGFPAKVSSALARHRLDPALLALEITESAFSETREEQVLATLRAIAAMGVRIEVDDFGTGYSSLSRLHLYPLSAIKVDRQFIMTLDDSARTIIAAVRLIADRFGLIMIAEGIEGAAQAQALLDVGADALQGYWLGRPRPLAEVLAALPLRVEA